MADVHDGGVHPHLDGMAGQAAPQPHLAACHAEVPARRHPHLQLHRHQPHGCGWRRLLELHARVRALGRIGSLALTLQVDR